MNLMYCSLRMGDPGANVDECESQAGARFEASKMSVQENVYYTATPYRGLAAVTAWGNLKFAALNLKKFAIHKWMRALLQLAISMIEATLQSCKVASLTI